MSGLPEYQNFWFNLNEKAQEFSNATRAKYGELPYGMSTAQILTSAKTNDQPTVADIRIALVSNQITELNEKMDGYWKPPTDTSFQVTEDVPPQPDYQPDPACEVDELPDPFSGFLE
jgi:hypothetical protein